MKDKATFTAVLIAALLAPVAAGAAPVVAWVATTFAVSTVVAGFIVRIGISLVLSSLSAALRKKPGQQRPPGIKTESTTSGGSNPQGFVLGKYATAGNMVAPPYSHPNNGNVPNEWLTYLLDVSDIPGVQLSRIMVAGEYVTDLEDNPDQGPAENPAAKLLKRGMLEEGKYHLYMTWHDGTQTAADPWMLHTYGEHPDRPWDADMVGTGVAYAVMAFRYNRKLFNNLPGVRFEVEGIPLYDPRKDSTAGGTGAHRWDDPSTWEFTANPVVMVYNILRGITLQDGQRWGGKVPASGLPLDNWFAGMNECDVTVDLADGGSEPQYLAGLEVSLDEEPAEVIAELMKACSGEISEYGGTYKVRVGPPGLPVYFFSDEDVVSDHPQNLTPYPGLDGVHNAIHATHPDPESLWEQRDAPPRYSAAWEAEDGGRQLVAQVDLPAVASGTQVQRLMKSWIEDERRFRRHSLSLPPDAAVLEPLDTVAWTSDREGYSTKLFEVGELTDDLVTCIQAVAIRERDAGDFTWVPGTDEVPVEHPSVTVTVVGRRTLPGWNLLAHSLPDGDGNARRPALRMVWTAADLLAGDVVEWEIQLADGTLVAAGTAVNPLSGEAVFASGILPSTEYRAKGRIRGRNNDGIWRAWKSATTGAVVLGYSDMAPQIEAEIDAAQATANDAMLDAAAAASAAAAAQAELDGVPAQLDGIRAENEAALAPIGGSVLRLPRGLWTEDGPEAHSSLTKPQVGVNRGEFLTNDPDFGECWKFAVNANTPIGPAYPIDFQPGRVFKVVVRVKCHDDGTTGGVRVHIGVTTQKGTERLEFNKQAEMAPLLAVADGVAEYTTYFSTDGDALDDYGLTYPGKFSLDAAASAEANKAYVHVRQNASGLTDGKLIVGSIYVTDVTEALAGVNTLRTELSASIGNAQADATQALTSAASNSSALAQAETSLQAGIDSVSAEVTTQGTAISNLEGNASAGYLIKAQGGSAVSLLSLIAADGSSGSVSVAKLQADQILLQGSVGMDMLAVGVGRNLLENPDLAQGETAISKTSSNTVGSGATMTVRSDGSYSDAFNRTIRLQTFAQATFDGYIGVRFRPPDGNTGTLAPGYLAEPDQFFEFSAQLAVRRVRVVLRLYWLDSSGAEISNTAVFDNNWGTSTEGDATGIGRWARYGGIGKAPAATKYVRPEIRIIGTDASSSTRDTHILRPMLAEADSLDAPLSSYAPGGTTLVSGGRVVTNSLYADAVNTLSFAAAGLAIFGNALQSSNFNGTINSSGNITAEGSAGWAIGKNGSMVLNNLVAREWVKVGAVSDGASWSRAGNAKAEDDDVLHNSTLGAFRLGDFWQIACRVKYRTYSQYNVWIPPAGKGDGYNSAQWMRTNVLLQWRTKTGGSWSSWSALHSFGESGLNVSWYEKEVVISKMGNYEDVQVRIKIDHSFYAINGGSVGSTQGTFNNIGDMTLYAKALVR